MLIANKHPLSEGSDIPNHIVSHDEWQLEVVSEARDFTRLALRIGDQLTAMRNASESALARLAPCVNLAVGVELASAAPGTY